MTSILNLPQARIALGWATIQGQRIPVEIDPEWMRYMTVLTERAGGIIAVENLYQTFNSLAQIGGMSTGAEDGDMGPPGPPGPTGPQGQTGLSIPGSDGEDGSNQIMMINSPYRTASTPVRALDTTYTNTSTSTLLVHMTVRCAVTLAGGNAYVQAKMDTATPPTVAASGMVGIQAGLLGEDNSFQLVFSVNPGGTYIVTSSATNGTVTLGTWFEITV